MLIIVRIVSKCDLSKGSMIIIGKGFYSNLIGKVITVIRWSISIRVIWKSQFNYKALSRLKGCNTYGNANLSYNISWVELLYTIAGFFLRKAQRKLDQPQL